MCINALMYIYSYGRVLRHWAIYTCIPLHTLMPWQEGIKVNAGSFHCTVSTFMGNTAVVNDKLSSFLCFVSCEGWKEVKVEEYQNIWEVVRVSAIFISF